MSLESKQIAIFWIVLIAGIMFFGLTANAEGIQCTEPLTKDKVDVVAKCPKVKERWRTVIKKVEVPVVVTKIKTVVKRVAVPVIKYKTRVKTRKLTRKVNFKKNHLNILIGSSKTKLEAKVIDTFTEKVSDKRELDVGLQYMREFGSFNGLIQATKNGNLYIGAGLSW